MAFEPKSSQISNAAAAAAQEKTDPALARFNCLSCPESTPHQHETIRLAENTEKSNGGGWRKFKDDLKGLRKDVGGIIAGDRPAAEPSANPQPSNPTPQNGSVATPSAGPDSLLDEQIKLKADLSNFAKALGSYAENDNPAMLKAFGIDATNLNHLEIGIKILELYKPDGKNGPQTEAMRGAREYLIKNGELSRGDAAQDAEPEQSGKGGNKFGKVVGGIVGGVVGGVVEGVKGSVTAPIKGAVGAVKGAASAIESIDRRDENK